MNFNLRQLEALYWAGRLGSFQAAANRLHTTQSAISKRVAELESALGCELFDRRRRNAQLTATGSRVAIGAEQMLTQARRLLDEVGEHRNESVFRLAVTELIGMTWLPKLMRSVADDMPWLRLEVEVLNGGVLLEQMNRGHYDVAILPGPMWGRIYEAVKLRALKRAWMASPSMAVPDRVLTVEELSEYPIASQFADTIHAQLQMAWFKRAGFPITNAVQAQTFAVLGQLTRTGVAIAQLPIDFYADELRLGELRAIQVSPDLPNVEYFAIFRRDGAHQDASAIAKLAKLNCDFSQPSKQPPASELLSPP